MPFPAHPALYQVVAEDPPPSEDPGGVVLINSFVNIGRYEDLQAFQAAVGQPGFRQAAAATQHRAHPSLYRSCGAERHAGVGGSRPSTSIGFAPANSSLDTIVSTEESWGGLLARLLCKRSATTLTTAIDTGLARLQAEAERRATP